MVATSRASTPRPPAAAKSAAAASSAATPAESPAGAQARAKAAANPADRAIAATRAPVPRAAPAAAPLSPLRCPSCVCAFAVWQTVLFAVEVLYYAQPGQALWAIGMGGHSALATLVVLMTAIEEDLKDLNNIPCFGRPHERGPPRPSRPRRQQWASHSGASLDPRPSSCPCRSTSASAAGTSRRRAWRRCRSTCGVRSFS
ncbi:unnamed protein product [Prorocentrum cordatum]|uniref:Uncharacterized protein n=1 Tax=Prorocentrum cordatum TaxID=2364126 RepID=A0ABN9QPZ8_9DINO|nr:unnamed protein product [Polarella glacialis]